MNDSPAPDTTVLVVDDQDDLRSGTALVLQKAGYRTLSAANGAEALRLMAAHHPDLVLLDWDMPDMDGLEVCRRIKADPSCADSIVVIASATFTDGEQQKAGLSTGADGFIARPVTNVDLVARVQAFARVARLTREAKSRAEETERALAALQRRQLAELNLLEDAVAERKKAEAALHALKESELIFKRFMENSPIYVFFKDENIRALSLSRNYEQLVGKPLDQQLGRSMDELFPSELARKMVEDDKNILATGKVVTVEEELNGRQYSTIKFPITVDGKPRFLAGYTTDVTEQKRAAKELADSELLYRTLVSAMGEGLMLHDENAVILEANKAAEQIFGLTADQLRGQSALDGRWCAVREDGAALAAEAHPVPLVLNTGLPQTDVTLGIRKPDGALVWVSVNAWPMFRADATKPYRVVATMRDVTARRQADAQLRESERQYRETLDQLMEGAMILDFNWTCLYANSTLARHGRQQVANLIGRNWLDIYPGIENTEVFAGYQAVMNDRVARRFEAPFIFADGSAAWFELNVTPVSQGIFVMSHEITDKKAVVQRDAALLDLEKRAGDMDEQTLLQTGLDKLESLTRSRIGFLHFVNADQDQISLVTWTSETMASYCHVSHDSHYPVMKAGIWAESIRTRQPVIINDYAAAPNKKGLPDGHAHLQRFVSVPVLDQGLVRMIVGVGNAALDYDDADATTISQFAYEMYRIVLRKRAEESLRASEAALRTSEEKFRGIVEQTMVGVYMLDGSLVSYANPRTEEIFGCGAGAMAGRPFAEFVVPEDLPKVQEEVERVWHDHTYVARIECRARHSSGKVVHVGAVGRHALLEGRAVVIGVVQDITDKVLSESKLIEYAARLERSVLGTVDAVSQMMDLRDPYTAGHEKRVGELSSRIAGEMGLSDHVQRGLRVAGGVHDVGKITVPAEILNRPGKISQIEFDMIKTHAEQGYQVLKNVDFPWPVAEVARQHHERIDGSGYPRGLKGEEIILEARILAVADVVEAMATHRPYRTAVGLGAALDEIEHGRGTAYDPVVVDACLRLFREKGYQLVDR